MENSENKTIIITGSSSGIGAFLAENFTKDGFNVVINYSKSKAHAQTLGKKLSKLGNVLLVKCDVSKSFDVKRLIEKTIQTFGRIDVLVNNAGIHLDGKVSNLAESSWNKVICTNLTGTFHCCKFVLPQMKKQKFGRIINMSSFTALVGASGAANYAASKAGIVALTKSLAMETASHGITVNAIAPGYFDIGMFYDFDKPTIEKILSNIPAKQLGQPQEIVELINVILSSSYLTGRTFVVDGGFSI